MEYKVICDTDDGYVSMKIEADSDLEMYTKLHMEMAGLPDGEEITDCEEYRKKLSECILRNTANQYRVKLLYWVGL